MKKVLTLLLFCLALNIQAAESNVPKLLTTLLSKGVIGVLSVAAMLAISNEEDSKVVLAIANEQDSRLGKDKEKESFIDNNCWWEKKIYEGCLWGAEHDGYCSDDLDKLNRCKESAMWKFIHSNK